MAMGRTFSTVLQRFPNARLICGHAAYRRCVVRTDDTGGVEWHAQSSARAVASVARSSSSIATGRRRTCSRRGARAARATTTVRGRSKRPAKAALCMTRWDKMTRREAVYAALKLPLVACPLTCQQMTGVPR